MWKVFHSNNICQLKDFKKENASYKNRLYKTKPVLNIERPYKPRNRNKGYSFDKYKTKYDNKILYKKKKEINNSKGLYNQDILRPYSSFSGIRNSHFEEYYRLKAYSVNEENAKMRKRIKNTKPVYSVEKMRKDAQNHNNYRNFLLDVLRKNRVTPLYNDEMENILNV